MIRMFRVCYPCSKIEDAIDYFEEFGEIVSVTLLPGPDGYLRGSAMIRIKETNEQVTAAYGNP